MTALYTLFALFPLYTRRLGWISYAMGERERESIENRSAFCWFLRDTPEHALARQCRKERKKEWMIGKTILVLVVCESSSRRKGNIIVTV